MNTNEIATRQDIELLKEEILKLKDLLLSQPKEKRVLRSSDVRTLLNISDGTLQRLRISGTLPATKISGTWFYKSIDVMGMINDNK